MNFLTNHANMTSAELNRDMVSFVTSCGHAFSSDMPMTSENVNWMTAVYAVEQGAVETAEDLTNLLAAMNKHYSGPISIHEGWGGCDADSNQELITEKLRFDISENWDGHNVLATLAAIELEWLDGDDYDNSVQYASMSFSIDANDEGQHGLDHINVAHTNYPEPGVELHAYGKDVETCHLYQERAFVPGDLGLYDNLHRAVNSLPECSVSRCAYIRSWAKRKGFEFQPHNTHLAKKAA